MRGSMVFWRCEVKLIGLTGGIGMGKSAAGDWLRARGLPMADSDQVAREICAAGSPALAEIEDRFGPEVIGDDGGLLRGELAKRVFGDERDRADLEAILHPRIREAWKAEAEGWRNDGRAVGAVQIPLLFETGAESEFDAVVCLACSPGGQQARLLDRGWDEEETARRIASQLPLKEKMERSDFVVWNESGLVELGEQLERIMDALGVADELKAA